MARRQIRTLTPTELARVQQGVLVRIVDDDDSLRDALRFVLETEGWRVVDYRSANDFFRGDAPSVRGCVVMDVRMPGLTGIEAQAVMNERGFSLPVIFLTGHGDIDMAGWRSMRARRTSSRSPSTTSGFWLSSHPRRSRA